jgi:dihydroflavonol-4-reductase
MSIVLVTGGSGFVGVHTILQLLAAGHEVRTTVRHPERNKDVLAMLREGGALSADRLSFFTADLTQDAGWGEATAGCDYVLHVASPLSSSVPRDENELIIPARDGTLRVLRASREAGVKRVVITSSTAAVAYGHKPQSQPFDESNWTNLDGGAEVQPYVKSKTLAERAAWDFIAKDGGASSFRSSIPSESSARFSGLIFPARSEFSRRCSTAPCRRCRKSISVWSMCAMSPICICVP